MKKTQFRAMTALAFAVISHAATAQDFEVANDRLQIELSKLPADVQDRLENISSGKRNNLGEFTVEHFDVLEVIGKETAAGNWSGVDFAGASKPLEHVGGKPMVEQVAEPERVVRENKKKIENIEAECSKLEKQTKVSKQDCVDGSKAPGLARINEELQAHIGPGLCSDKARDYKAYLLTQCSSGCTRDPAVANPYDDLCLNSLIPWRRADGQLRSDDQPAVFHQGGERDGRKGILDAVALIDLVDANAGTRSQLCGGLLLSGNRVLTARHCFNLDNTRIAWREGRLYVRAVRDAKSPGWPLKFQKDFVANPDVLPALDAFVVSIDSTDAIAAPVVRFVNPDKPQPAIVLGYFRDYNRERVLSDPTHIPEFSTWQQALRWPKSGLCHVQETHQGCVRSVCQTIPGYSGAPLFALDQSPDTPLTVFGVISNGDRPDANCGQADSEATLVASVAHIAP